MVDITMVSFICTNDHDHISDGRVLGKPPVINGNGWGWAVGNIALVNLVQKHGVRVDGLLFQVPCNPVSKLGRHKVQEEIRVEENSPAP